MNTESFFPNEYAFPKQTPDGDSPQRGLTIRQYAIIHCNMEPPTWFEHISPQKQLPEKPSIDALITSPLTEDEMKLIKDWTWDPIYDLPQKLMWFQEKWEKENSEYFQAYRKHQLENNRQRIIQWRSFFADMIVESMNLSK